MRQMYTKQGHAFIFVYSITSRSSFEAISTFREQVLQVREADSCTCLLVGNKVDLAEDQRMVSREEGEKLAKSFGCPFMEITAKDRRQVDDVFETIVREIWKTQKEGKGEFNSK